jgi:hypothetical protein
MQLKLIENEVQLSDVNYKHPDSTVKVLNIGSRGSLHPTLNILDSINCQVTYFKRQKLILVDYDYDEENDKYRKSIFSTNVANIVSDITIYKQDNA